MSNQIDQPFFSNKNLSWLLIIGVILVGANLRVPLTSAGALVSFIVHRVMYEVMKSPLY